MQGCAGSRYLQECRGCRVCSMHLLAGVGRVQLLPRECMMQLLASTAVCKYICLQVQLLAMVYRAQILARICRSRLLSGVCVATFNLWRGFGSKGKHHYKHTASERQYLHQ